MTASTSISGELLGTVDYSPYGEATGPLLSAFGYAGEWVDNATGYTYLRMRLLDTETGTFLSEDPLVQTTNSAFGYTEGNPITQIDPLGLLSWGDVGMGVLRYSGYVSAALSLAGIATASTVGGAPVGAVLVGISLLFGAGALVYDLGNCLGYFTDAECNWGLVALDIAGLTSGGTAQIIGRGSHLSSRVMTAQLALDNTSFVAGFTGPAIGAVNSLNDKKNSNNKKKEKC